MKQFPGKLADASSLPSLPSTAKNSVKIDWAEFSTSSKYVRRTGWQHRPIPGELNQLPDNVEIPEKLKQIITWSLMPSDNWSFQIPPRKDDSKLSTAQTGSIKSVKSDVASASSINESLTPTSSIDNISSVSSIDTAQTQLTQEIRGRSPAGEKSMKSKLLIAMGFAKSNEGESSTASKPEPQTVECTSCFEDLPEAEMTQIQSCRHWYCKVCLSTLIVTAMAAESSFPPKCCLSPIPLQQILRALDGKQREHYQEKTAEYAVPTTDRWYCPGKDCLKWIPAAKLKRNKNHGYNCPHCAMGLCRTCRGPAHPAKTECPQDFGLEATLETAEIEGWQRCYSCRALVEHNTGCRHMTCRCRAQFCYVCGLRWQTCSCTERDATDKRAAAQRRREERTVRLDEEAAEIARAIAEVEEMERREEAQRLIEEERRRREEEEQLRQLEVQRQEEESKKRQEAEKAEREFRLALVTSFEEEWNHMEEVYRQLLASQSEAVNSRHEAEDAKLGQARTKDDQEAKQMFEPLGQMLAKNCRQRHTRLTVRQKAAVTALGVRQEEEEDDMFLQVQMRLRGKPNKESRMERMLSEIRKQHGDEREELDKKHKTDFEKLEAAIEVDAEGLKKHCENKVEEIKDKQSGALQKFGHAIGADRQYFELVFERRRNMLTKHGSIFLSCIQAGEESIGLTEFEASKIGPFLPEFEDGEPGPSGISRKPNAVMTTHGPLSIGPSQVQSSQHTSSSDLLDPLPTQGDITGTHSYQVIPLIQTLSRPSIPGSYPEEALTTPSLPIIVEPLRLHKAISGPTTINKLDTNTQRPYSSSLQQGPPRFSTLNALPALTMTPSFTTVNSIAASNSNYNNAVRTTTTSPTSAGKDLYTSKPTPTVTVLEQKGSEVPRAVAAKRSKWVFGRKKETMDEE